MKVVFVNPPITKEERYGVLAPAGSYAPPLALCSLAAVARGRGGHEALIVDAQIEGLDHVATLARVLGESPGVVGITSTTSTFLSAAELATSIKQSAPEITVVAGGVHVSALPRETLQEFKGIDVLVVGEGEDTLLELLPCLEKNSPLRDIAGLAYRDEGEGGVIITAPRPLMKDLDSLELPAWDLLKGFPESCGIQAQSVSNFPSTSVCSSRGCLGKCSFCDRRIFGSRLRAHSAEYVMKVIRDLYDNFGIRDIQFEDDNFMLFKKRLLGLCQMIRDSGMDLTWSCQARVDSASLELFQVMRDSGCRSVLFGVESGSPRVLEMMKKEISLKDIDRAVQLSHKAGLRCKGLIITGFLGEDRETLRETRQYLKQSDFDDISMHYFAPFPGSEAYGHAEEFGTFDRDWRKMNFYEIVFVPEGLTKEDLISHTKLAYRQFYLSPKTLFKYLSRVRSLRSFLYLARSGLALVKYIFQSKTVD